MAVEIPESVIADLKERATKGASDGRETPLTEMYISACSAFHGATGTSVIFTRDTGHHTSGWMKNPDYERCLHLSLSFREPQDWPVQRLGSPRIMARFGIVVPLAPFDRRQAKAWVDALLGDDQRYAWCEPAFSAIGKQLEVMHWRVFCDPAWVPFKPRGEVYSKEFTEARWKSWSEVQGEDAEPNWVSAD